MLVFYYGNGAIAVIGLFILFAVPAIAKCCKSDWLNETASVADDFYKECSFEFLTRELRRTQEEFANFVKQNKNEKAPNVKIMPVFANQIDKQIKMNIYIEFLESKREHIETRIKERAYAS